MPDNKTTIDLIDLIVLNHPVTELSTVQELLRLSKIATDVIGQRYTICTFDLAIVMKALEILWNEKEKYRDFIIQIGAFHTISAYFNVLGKKMEGSGFAEVVLESGVCSSGSINGVMKEKLFNRAMGAHIAVCDAREWLLLERFVRSVDGSNMFTPDVKKLPSNLHEDPGKECLEVSIEDPSFIHFFDGYKKFRKDAASGLHGKTAQFGCLI